MDKNAACIFHYGQFTPFFANKHGYFFARLIFQLAIVMNTQKKYKHIQQLNLYKCTRSLTRTASSASSWVHHEGLTLSLPSVKCYK